MEPKIIKGHAYRCKQTVVCKGDKKASFIKGKIYYCTVDSSYPDPQNYDEGDKHLMGWLVNEQGQQHSWPYYPEYHLWCHDCWTEDFEDLGEHKK